MPRPATLIVTGLLLALPAVAMGNGVYFPQKVVTSQPAILLQRALIVHRGGVETLIVESSFDTSSKSVGWVLPLPVAPTKFEPADPGMLTALEIAIGPRIVHDLFLEIRSILIALVIMLAYGTVMVTVKKRSDRWTAYIAFAMVILVVSSCLLPSMGSAGLSGGSRAGLEVLATQRVGRYDVTILKSGDAAVLSSWLADNGFAQPDAAGQGIIGDYVRRKWCFAVAKLVPDAAGKATPHPLRVEFPADRPIFPMELTAIAGSATRVELFVLAHGSAAADKFHVVASDGYTRVGSWYAGRSTDLQIAQPAMMELMWDGCVLTRLTATLTPAEMNRDVEIAVGQPRAHRDLRFSGVGRRSLVVLILLAGFGTLTLPAMYFLRRKDAVGHVGRRIVGLMCLLVLAGTGVFWVAAPIVPVRVVPAMSFVHAAGMRMVCRILAVDSKLSPSMSDREIADAIDAALRDDKADLAAYRTNPYTGQPVRCERSAGNYFICRQGETVWLCTYDRSSRETRWELFPLRP
ncbi:MAG: DUF2330 domain-containing protein [Phycisphaerae bacterium]|nr:DUF2330 domain-containing protein [Phycisphaerae bacterium]